MKRRGRNLSAAPISRQGSAAIEEDFYENKYCLAIGINLYEHWPTLSCAAHDALEVAKTLEQNFGFQSTTLINEAATRGGIQESIVDSLRTKALKEDLLVVFFAGHGHTERMPDEKDHGYIVPIEARTTSLSDLIPMSQLIEWTAYMACRHILYIFDSCFSGIATHRANPSRVSRDMFQRKARLVITAGGADQRIEDGGWSDHSVFTGQLLLGLLGGADRDRNGIITATELFAYLETEIPKSANQTPALGCLPGHEGGDIFFPSQQRRSKKKSKKRVIDDIAIKPDSAWTGTAWKDRFLAYDGPIELIRMIEDEVFQQSMADTLTSAGYTVRLAALNRLSSHAEKGYRIIHLTDQQSWRRRVVQANKVLIARPNNSTEIPNTGSRKEEKPNLAKQRLRPTGVSRLRKACFSLTSRFAHLIIDNRRIITRERLRKELNEFLISGARYCLLRGPSGVGKSVFLAVEAKRLLKSVWTPLLFSGASFSIDNATKLIAEEYSSGAVAAPFRRIIRQLLEEGNCSSRGVVILIDAIDDADPGRIATELSDLNDKIGDLPVDRVKVIISCRDISWGRLHKNPVMPVYKDAAQLGRPSAMSSFSIEVSDFTPEELDDALEAIGAKDLLNAGKLDKQDDWHVSALRALIKHPATFEHFARVCAPEGFSTDPELTWSKLIEQSIKESLASAGRLCGRSYLDLHEHMVSFSAIAYEERSRTFQLDLKNIETRLPDLFSKGPNSTHSPYSALLENGTLVEYGSDSDTGTKAGIRITDAGAFFLSIELEKRVAEKPIEDVRKIVGEWLQESWNYIPLLDAILAWVDRLADRPYEPRLLSLLELLIKSYRSRDGLIFRLMRPTVIASIFEIIKHGSEDHFYSYRDAARQIRPSPEAIRIARDHLRDPNTQVRELATELIGVFGDSESHQELVALFEDTDKDVRQRVYGAIRRIGRPAVGSLLKVINDSSQPPGLRSHCLAALRGVGYRDDRISASLRYCIEEDSISGKLLEMAFLAAAYFRDKGHTASAINALKQDDLDVVQAAAKYLTEVPHSEAFEPLREALRPRQTETGEVIDRYWVPDQIMAALVKADKQKAYPIILELIREGLQGEGELSPVEGVWKVKKFEIPAAYAVLLKKLAAQLAEKPERNIVTQAAETLGDAWRTDVLGPLVEAAKELADKGMDLAQLFVDSVSAGMKISDGYPLADQLSRVSDLYTLAKCQVENFVPEATRLLSEAEHWNLTELCELFWVAGDCRAEQALIHRLENPLSEAKQIWYERNNIARALGTCGTSQGWQAIVYFLRSEENVLRNFDKEGLHPLAIRKVISAEDLIEVIKDTSIHVQGRTAGLLALAMVDLTAHKEVFANIAENEEQELLQQYGVRLLGFTKDSSVAPVLQNVLRISKKRAVRSEAAKALSRLGIQHAIHDIEYALEESPDAGFISALARFQEKSSLRLMLNGIGKGPADLYREYLKAMPAFYEYQQAKEIIEEQFTTWSHGRMQLFDDQTPVINGMIKYQPERLLEKASWLMDHGCLNSSARSELARSIPRLYGEKRIKKTLLREVGNRLICDPNVSIREQAVQAMAYTNKVFCRKVYRDLNESESSGERKRACAVYTLPFWSDDTSEIENARYDKEFLVRRAADQALSVKERKKELQQHIKCFVEVSGLPRLSSYLCLKELGDLSTLKDLHEKTPEKSIPHVFLRKLGSEITDRLQKEFKDKQEKEDKLHESRGTVWFD